MRVRTIEPAELWNHRQVTRNIRQPYTKLSRHPAGSISATTNSPAESHAASTPRPSRRLINTTRLHTPLSTHKGGLMSNRGAHCCFTVSYLLYKPLMIFFSLIEIARRNYRRYRMSSRTGDYPGHILRRDSLSLVVSIYGRSKCFTASQGGHQSCAFQEMV
jgi:hypothetical protein